MAITVAPAASSKQAVKKVGRPKAVAANKPEHITTSQMVSTAISALNDRKGSSLQAIKKYIATTYEFDVKRQAHLIKRALKSSIDKQTIVQTTGTGANGRFKLVLSKPEPEKKPKKTTEKPSDDKKQPRIGKSRAVKPQIVDKPAMKSSKAPDAVKPENVGPKKTARRKRRYKPMKNELPKRTKQIC